MIKEGEYITCKKSLYSQDDTFLEKIKNRLFESPLIKKGEKIKVVSIKKYKNNKELYFINIKSIFIENGFLVEFPKSFISKYFYTEQEIRKLKLKKLKS